MYTYITIMKNKLHIAILAGGISSEYEVSLRSGKEIGAALNKEKYIVDMIEISKQGVFIKNSSKLLHNTSHKEQVFSIIDPSNGLQKSELQSYDLIFNAMHGQFGEDGRVQALLDILEVPYTGSGVLASALGMNKQKTLQLVETINIATPQTLLVRQSQDIDSLVKQITQEIGFPCVIKPNQSGSSVGISIVEDKHDLSEALDTAFTEDKVLQVQQYISGREVTCGVLGNSGQTTLEALPVVEIISQRDFFDYEAKYNDTATQEICPAQLIDEVKQQVQTQAKQVHELLGCDGLTRSDFILADDGTLFFLEINTLPGMTAASLCPKEARAAGYTFAEFLDKIVELALLKYT